MQTMKILFIPVQQALLWYARKRAIRYIDQYFRDQGYSEDDIEVACAAVSALVAVLVQVLIDTLVQAFTEPHT